MEIYGATMRTWLVILKPLTARRLSGFLMPYLKRMFSAAAMKSSSVLSVARARRESGTWSGSAAVNEAWRKMRRESGRSMVVETTCGGPTSVFVAGRLLALAVRRCAIKDPIKMAFVV